MAQTSAYQLQRTDIRINSICPGLIETGMTEATFEYARQRGSGGKIGQLNPLGRFGIAEGISFDSCSVHCLTLPQKLHKWSSFLHLVRHQP